MGKIFQLKTKTKINNVIGANFTFNVPSKWQSGKPGDDEIKAALESQFGKDAASFSAFASHKYEVLNP